MGVSIIRNAALWFGRSLPVRIARNAALLCWKKGQNWYVPMKTAAR